MDWGFWAVLFLIFLVVTPAVQLSVGLARERHARRILQRERGARVIPLVLELQTVATYGLPVARFEQLPLPNEVERAVRRTPQGTPIDLVVDLPAGVRFDMTPVTDALAARRASGGAPTTLIVPRRALTGGMALARAADILLLGPGALLGDQAASAGEATGSGAPAESAAAIGTAAPAETAAAPAAGAAQPSKAAAGPPAAGDLARLKALGLPAEEGLPAAFPAYLARFREPVRPRRSVPFYIAQPRAHARA